MAKYLHLWFISKHSQGFMPISIGYKKWLELRCLNADIIRSAIIYWHNKMRWDCFSLRYNSIVRFLINQWKIVKNSLNNKENKKWKSISSLNYAFWQWIDLSNSWYFPVIAYEASRVLIIWTRKCDFMVSPAIDTFEANLRRSFQFWRKSKTRGLFWMVTSSQIAQ